MNTTPSVAIPQQATEADTLGFLNNMFKNIGDVYKEDKFTHSKPTTYFTDGQSVYRYNLDGTHLEPTIKTALSGARFDQVYLKQLESILYTESDKLDENQLFHLIRLYGFFEEVRKHDQNAKVKLISGKYHRFIPRMVKILNQFLKANESIIQSSYKMMNGMLTPPPTHTQHNQNG